MQVLFIRLCLLVLLLMGFVGVPKADAQYFLPTGNKKKAVIPFKLVRNLVIVKIKINGKGPYNFVMDTGVGLMIITDPGILDSVKLVNKRIVKLNGIDGKGSYDAVLLPDLKVDIPGLTSYYMGAAVFTKDHFGISNYAGIAIHGLLGYEFFSSMAVKVNFNDSTITAYKPEYLSHLKKYTALPITIEHNKPYLETPVHFCDSTIRNCKLLADLGSGTALILNNLQTRNWPLAQSIPGNLGVGLTGTIEGKLGRVKSIDLGKYRLQSVLSCFPDTIHLVSATEFDGNIGIDVFRKFNIIFDYPDNKIYLKPRYNLKEPFEHDMTGIEYYAAGDDLKHVIISRVEPGSPAEEASLRIGDELTAINFKPVSKMSLDEIEALFRSKDGRNLVIEVYNNKKYENVIITLKRRI